jgi:toxin ParE1/3/4
MSGRLIIRQPVVVDMEGIADYLAERSLDAADRFLDACRADFQRLVDMPGIGRLREFENPRAAGIRSWPITGFRNYLIFYRPIENGVEILHVIHGARDIDAIFESPDDAN